MRYDQIKIEFASVDILADIFVPVPYRNFKKKIYSIYFLRTGTGTVLFSRITEVSFTREYGTVPYNLFFQM